MNETSPQPTTVGTLSSTLALLGFLILLGNVALVAFDVVVRWLVHAPQSWVSDVAELTYPIAFAAFFPAALEGGYMIVITFLGAVLGQRWAWLLDSLGQITMTLLLALFTWKVFERVLSEWTTGFATVNLAVPIAPSWLIVSALLLVATLVQAHRSLRICLGRQA